MESILESGGPAFPPHPASSCVNLVHPAYYRPAPAYHQAGGMGAAGRWPRMRENARNGPATTRLYSSHTDLLSTTNSSRVMLNQRHTPARVQVKSSSLTNSPVISINTRSSSSSNGRKRRHRRGGGGRDDNGGGGPRPEKMVRIRCARLNSTRQQEEVEIEIPLAVYNNMQGPSASDASSSTTTSSSNGGGGLYPRPGKRPSLAHKLRRIFSKHIA